MTTKLISKNIINGIAKMKSLVKTYICLPSLLYFSQLFIKTIDYQKSLNECNLFD